LRRILVRLQGAPQGAYCLYVTFGATPKTGQKTSKIVDLFISEALRSITGQFEREFVLNMRSNLGSNCLIRIKNKVIFSVIEKVFCFLTI
jgi:hypothetical protein